MPVDFSVKPDWLYRGYTGHEMLPQFGLINMNGRMYDPLNGRMLRPDNYIQEPGNGQSYNRYSYCFNNPLKYTDPSGEVVLIDDLVLGLIGGAMNLVNNFGSIHSLNQGIGFFTVGFISGALAEYITSVGSAALMGAGNAALGGYFRDGKIDPAEVVKGAILSSATASLTMGLGNHLGPHVTKLFPNMPPGVLKEALVQGIIGAPLGAAADGSGNILQAMGQGALFGMGTGVVIGGITGYINARNNNLDPWTGRSTQRPPIAEVEKITPKGMDLTRETATKVEIEGLKSYNSLTEVFGENYQSIAVAQGKHLPIELGKKLNTMSLGTWNKVYEAGILNGSKVEVHYFYNSNTGQYVNPFIKMGEWGSKVFKGIR